MRFFERVLENLRALRGVEPAATIDTLPLQGGSSQPVTIDGAPPMAESELPIVAVRIPSAGYFGTARIPILAGRDFSGADSLGRPRVAMVSEQAAKRFWPNGSPLGQRISLSLMSDDRLETVGVVGEVKTGGLDEREPQAAVYLPSAQVGFNGAVPVIRTAVPPDTLVRPMVAAVQAIDPEQSVLDIQTMETVREESLGQRRFAMLLLGAFALLALVLAAVGLYSVLAYTVRQRVKEIGIRLALGAPASGVLRLVVIEGMKPTLIGVAVGLFLPAALGTVATLLPAYRATRVDPIVTLRAE